MTSACNSVTSSVRSTQGPARHVVEAARRAATGSRCCRRRRRDERRTPPCPAARTRAHLGARRRGHRRDLGPLLGALILDGGSNDARPCTTRCVGSTSRPGSSIFARKIVPYSTDERGLFADSARSSSRAPASSRSDGVRQRCRPSRARSATTRACASLSVERHSICSTPSLVAPRSPAPSSRWPQNGSSLARRRVRIEAEHLRQVRAWRALEASSDPPSAPPACARAARPRAPRSAPATMRQMNPRRVAVLPSAVKVCW